MSPKPSLVHQTAPTIRLFMSDGSERSDYMPQEQAIARLGRPHAGINLMSCYYPRQSFWPDRRLFGDDVPHYRHSLADQTERTRLKDPAEWTDGYYSFDITDSHNQVVQQMEDVRRYGQDVRLTVTADIDTPDAELQQIARMLKDFGPVELRLNHEANGCSWFRYARNVGGLSGDAARQLYFQISQFFIRAERAIREAAPNVTLVGCYNGPGDPSRWGTAAGQLPSMGDDELGLMYKLPNIQVSLDQYGSLHYGWPGHTITDAPIIGAPQPDQHRAFALTTHALCELVIRPFQQAISAKRGQPTRIDLGELDFDEDIHGPDIRAQLIYECYAWIRRNPQVIGSVTFYELTDKGGLGIFRQKDYGSLADLTYGPLLDVYRRIMSWDEFRPKLSVVDPLAPAAARADLCWNSISDSLGLEVVFPRGTQVLDLREAYWRRIILADEQGAQQYVHTDAVRVPVPQTAVKATIFILPPDGRNNAADGYRRSVPIPAVSA